jgi:NAD(P)-dependent dehydrogenase (short-subunit alcohol dehydrogenase family)
MTTRGYGKIVNTASLLSFQGGMTVPAYAASKGAIAQLAKALCNEWSSKGVNVNAVPPGYMATEMNAALLADSVRMEQLCVRIPAGRWGRPQDIATSWSSLPRPPPLMCTVRSSPSTAAGWPADRPSAPNNTNIT